MIILEGPDGAGKTTLLRKILRAQPMLKPAPRACTSEGGPVPDLARWVDDDISEWPNKDTMVYDRYPLFSEVVYGPIVRGENAPGFTAQWLAYNLKLVKEGALVIVCLPPLMVVKAALQEEYDELNHEGDEPVRIPHGYEHAEAIWSMYSNLMPLWSHLFNQFIYYDYTQTHTHCNEPGCMIDHDDAVMTAARYYHLREAYRMQNAQQSHVRIG